MYRFESDFDRKLTILMIDDLNNRFGLGDQLVFSPHPSGLVRGVVKSKACTGEFFLLGAHVSAFQPTDQTGPLLFMSSKSVYQVGQPIRGGVPICFPWFGANKADSQAPGHGLARIRVWEIAKTERKGDTISVMLETTIDQLNLAYTLAFGTQLDLSLAITNVGDHARECEAALHTYFQLSDVREVRVFGLETLGYLDTLTHKTMPATGQAIRFTEETDRIYSGEVASIAIEDPGFARNIEIRPRNSRSTVVWNPWVAKSIRMPDFGDDEYLRMCCIETANVGLNRISLAVGQQQSIAVSISTRNHCE